MMRKAVVGSDEEGDVGCWGVRECEDGEYYGKSWE